MMVYRYPKTGSYRINMGEKIKILVGQHGSDAPFFGNGCGNGGGGSFVVKSDNTAILVAGGGGGSKRQWGG